MFIGCPLQIIKYLIYFLEICYVILFFRGQPNAIHFSLLQSAKIQCKKLRGSSDTI